MEEYFGVCLTFVPEMLDEPEALCRERSERLYRAYREEEKASDRQKRPDGAAARGRVSGKTVFL